MARNTSGEQYAASKYIELPVRKESTLMVFLMEQMSGTSRNRVKDLLAGHAVTVDRKLVTRYDYPLQEGMMVRVTRHKRSSELNSKFVKIIYEDKDIIVIEKSEGILSMASAPGQYCVKTILDEYFKKRHFKCTAHVVHRLDRETSGLMMYAKTQEAQRILEENWHRIVFDRRYVAVVCGKMEKEGGTVRSWLKDNKAFITYSSPTDNGGKEAITHYHTLATSERISLVEMLLETGRKNQIRVHMKDLGHPIVGDQKYGNGFSIIGRLALHAYRLNFYHPMTGQVMEFETPFPQKFVQLFKEYKQEADGQEETE
ncbi:MAG: RluA family pseudouridine synthase [Bacteroidaceae bacterium]|nr:RluA family pseudouridine synthase [Bacteroidaceae bacterium]